jgi:uncharacterized membrane protein
MRLVTALSNKLTRIRVTGTWDEMEFTKEPVRDISAATIDFVKEALALGGQLGPNTRRTFTGLFSGMEQTGPARQQAPQVKSASP